MSISPRVQNFAKHIAISRDLLIFKATRGGNENVGPEPSRAQRDHETESANQPLKGVSAQERPWPGSRVGKRRAERMLLFLARYRLDPVDFKIAPVT